MEISQFSDGRLRSEPVAEARDFASVRIATTAAWTILSSRRSGSGFVLGRKPARKRMRAKQREFKDQLLATLHDGIEVQRRWLAQVLRGWFAYYAVPMSGSAFRRRSSSAVDAPSRAAARGMG